MIRPQDLLCPRPEGLYCPPGDFYIDPVRPVDRAVVTHGHSDHARAGHGAVLATPETLDIMAERYGQGFAAQVQAAPYGETAERDGVEVTLVPAGHVLGSAQAVVRWKGLTIVVSGDYKRRRDPTCPSFEPVPCHVFISEATFGLPVFRHHPPTERRSLACCARWRSSPSAATSSAPMRWARRNGSSACCARRVGTGPFTSTGRWSV